MEWPIDMFSKVKGPFQGGLVRRPETPLPIGGRHSKKERERKRTEEHKYRVCNDNNNNNSNSDRYTLTHTSSLSLSLSRTFREIFIYTHFAHAISLFKKLNRNIFF